MIVDLKKIKSIFFHLGIFFFMLFISYTAAAQNGEYTPAKGEFPNRVFFNLEKYWDSSKPCNNPHKGWSLHYYDNAINKYGNRLQPTDSLNDFPCLNDIYLRLAWAYLEPEEGKYNWILLDSIIDRWVSRGHTISFRVTCKETDDHLPYAVPEWVVKKGAKGTMVGEGANKAWAPDYGDPIFLEKLEKFHKAFADRYDSKPWIEYIDIGSMGEWGEGHTLFSNWYDIPLSVIKKHIDIFKRCYKKSKLIISDDIMGLRLADDRADEQLLLYCLKNKIGFRDDSIYVPWYSENFGYSTLRLPEIFNLSYRSMPVILESDHYQTPINKNTYQDGRPLEKAIEEMHASLVGFHHYPREWLNENRDLAVKLGNKAGYWFFPKYALMPDTLRKNSTNNYLKITWENHGVAPAYRNYRLKIMLISRLTGKNYVQPLVEAKTITWFPGDIIAERYAINVLPNLQQGMYDVLIRIDDSCGFHTRPIQLPLKKDREIMEDWYKLGEVVVAK
jgi:hypothetical protein